MSTTLPDGHAWVYLDTARALGQIGDLQALRGMLPLVEELLERDVSRIAQRLANQDVHGANLLLHAFKGCLPIFCTPALCEHLVWVESMSKTGNSAEVGEAFAQLRPKLQQLQRELVQYLAQPVGAA